MTRMAEHIAVKDLRMVDHEVLMPASQPLFGGAHVTTSSYDLPSEVRSQRRKALQAAVEAGAGDGATQRDRDLYVKGLLTGVAHQLAVIEASYGPVVRLSAVRHWPKGVIPGSLELLGELDGGAQVRLVWHYLPFAPEYSESLQVLSARRRMRVELPAPSHGDRRSTISLREKKSGVVQETSTTAPKGAAELMWEAFHGFVEKGKEPVSGAAQARDQVVLLREVLSAIVVADGRSLEAEQSDEDAEPGGADDATADDATTDDVVTADGASADRVASDSSTAGGEAAEEAISAGDTEPATETLEQPVPDAEPAEQDPAVDTPAVDEVTDAWGPGLAPTDAAAEAPVTDPAVEDAPAGEDPRP
ncbi:hypothetical protein [Brachybacterium avium]|uniref:hypothetical protein n=1 Tax=Brachybacterium avium TaxID=2017485 RepID=UPI001FECCCFF|nr:hypothetical protein [Brachybacterium avium]